MAEAVRPLGDGEREYTTDLLGAIHPGNAFMLDFAPQTAILRREKERLTGFSHTREIALLSVLLLVIRIQADRTTWPDQQAACGRSALLFRETR